MLTVAEAIRERRSIRSFRSDPVPEEMILQILERIPDPGETVKLSNLEFRILKADGRSIKKVLVRHILQEKGQSHE